MKSWCLLIMLLLTIPVITNAQQKSKERKGEFYFSWGYNKEWYTRSDVKVNQPSLAGPELPWTWVAGSEKYSWSKAAAWPRPTFARKAKSARKQPQPGIKNCQVEPDISNQHMT